MKKILLSMILAVMISFAYAQRQSVNVLSHVKSKGNVAEPLQWRYSCKDNMQVLSGNEDLLHPESMIWRWDTILTYDTIGLTTRYIQTCDNHGIILYQTIEQWQTNTWVNSWRYSYTYDANGHIQTYLDEVWQSNMWVNYWHAIYTYDAHGNIMTVVDQFWQSNAWVNSTRFTNTYDSLGNILTGLREQWQTSAWVNDTKEIYTYDGSGNILTIVTVEWNTNAWVNFIRDTYTADTVENTMTIVDEQWQSGAWVNSRRNTYTYDVNGNELSELEESWQTNTWVNSWWYSFTYDSQGNSVTGKCESWHGGIWRADNNYMDLASRTNKIYFIYLVHRYEASYRSFIAGIQNTHSDNSFFTVYPNPSNNEITISIKQIKDDKNTLLSIFDMQGSLVLKQTLQKGKTEIEISRFSKGIYLLRLTNGGNENTTRIVKE